MCSYSVRSPNGCRRGSVAFLFAQCVEWWARLRTKCTDAVWMAAHQRCITHDGRQWNAVPTWSVHARRTAFGETLTRCANQVDAT